MDRGPSFCFVSCSDVAGPLGDADAGAHLVEDGVYTPFAWIEKERKRNAKRDTISLLMYIP
jgi:hypothetical protein